MSYKVLVTLPSVLREEDIRKMEEDGCQLIYCQGNSHQDILSKVGDCDAVIAYVARLDKEILDAGKNLKSISRCGVGVDSVDMVTARARGIRVTNSPTSNTVSVAEHVMYLVLACAKNGQKMDRVIREGRTEEMFISLGEDIEGKTLGIVGCGRIGRAAAQRAVNGFGMKAIGFDSFLPEGADLGPVKRVDSLEELLRTADFISLHVPATPDTHHMIGREQLAMMKPTAYLINAARGSVICEADLVRALEEKTIAGAGLDTFEKEPVSPDNPLLKFENVVVSPHYAARTVESLARASHDVTEGTLAIKNGNKPRWEVY